MSRGKKLDLFIGADIENGWAQVESSKSSKIQNEILDPSKHSLVFKKEKRRGKIVTLVGPFHLRKENALSQLKYLKKKIGCGGSFKDDWMEFQGELQEKLRTLLKADNFRFKNNK